MSSAGPYGADYWQWLDAQGVASYDEAQAAASVHAISAAAQLAKGARILDYGCGRGGLVTALLQAGYDAQGVDISGWAVTHAQEAARGHIFTLSDRPLTRYPDAVFELVVAKDVFEHIPEEDLHELVAELMRIGRKLLFICPVTDAAHHFICPNDELDDTHVTRHTASEWLTLFPCHASRYDEVTRAFRGDATEHGSVSVLLTQD